MIDVFGALVFGLVAGGLIGGMVGALIVTAKKRISQEPNYPGHPDDWTDEQWAHYMAWTERERG